MSGMNAYGKSFGVYSLLNHGDADGECLAIEMAVLWLLSIDSAPDVTLASIGHSPGSWKSRAKY
jgi:hypothetical protein